MSSSVSKQIGPRFFAEQDQLRGGPADDLCAANYTATIGSNPPMNLAGHQQFATLFYSAFPDLNHTIDDTIAENGAVTVRFTLRGTHTADFMGIPATHKPIMVSAIATLHIVEGKVTELRAIFDQVGMLQQLSVMPGA